MKKIILNAELFITDSVNKNLFDITRANSQLFKAIARIKDEFNKIKIQITDSGKGIAKSKFKKIFKPGYTTKKRGWGLGLSLSKRIIEDYHKGRILVKSSDINKATTFEITLDKVS